MAEVISELAGVPEERLLESDAERLLRLEELLGNRIVGHGHARKEQVQDMVMRLLNANIKNDLRALEEIAGLLEEIHSAWRDIAPNKQQQAVA